MASRRFRRELAEHLPTWQERGWVTPDAAGALRATYELDRPDNSNVGSIVLGIFGSALLLGGLILILAHNWEELGRPLRGLLAVLPLILTVGLAHWAVRRRPASVALAESLGIANALALALAISLVAQTYQISGDFPRFLMTWALFSLGIAYVLGSGLVLVLFHVLLMSWAWNTKEAVSGVVLYWLLVAASLPFLTKRGWAGDRPSLCAWIRLPIFLCITAALMAPLRHAHAEAWLLLIFFPWFAGVQLVAEAPERPLGGGIRWLASLGTAVMLLILSFERNWRHLNFDFVGYDGHDGASVAACVLGLLMDAALIALVVARHRTMDLTAWLWAAAGLSGLAAWLLQPDAAYADLAMGAANLLACGLAVVTMIAGIRGMNALRTNLGWLLLSALILCRFFDSNLSFLARGLAFIGLGLGFLALNVVLRRASKRAAGASTQSTPSTGASA